MKKAVPAVAFLLSMSSAVYADVSNEVNWGIEHDSLTKVTSESTFKGPSSTTTTSNDLSDKYDESYTAMTVGYSHFFSPLKDDDKPIDLRKFYQHPSRFEVATVFVASESEDRTAAITDKTDADLAGLALSGEFYLPSNTGFLVGLGRGTGGFTANSGTLNYEADIELNMIDLGVRQYIGRSVALHIRHESEKYRWDYTKGTTGRYETKTGLTLLGGEFVIKDVVGILLEIGGGKQKSEFSSGGSTEYDAVAINTELAVFIGKSFSVRLGIDMMDLSENGLPSGVEHETADGKVTLAPRYWFNEHFGIEAGIYGVTSKDVFRTSTTEYTDTYKHTGGLLRAAARF